MLIRPVSDALAVFLRPLLRAQGSARPPISEQHGRAADTVELSGAPAPVRATQRTYGPALAGDDQAQPVKTARDPVDQGQLTPEEKRQVAELRARDREVRAHEAAHKAAAGQHAAGAPSFSYQTGPDGKRYAVGGEVAIDVSPVAGDPSATIRKMQQIRRAALAPADPSPQDRQVAAQATKQESVARQEALQPNAEQSSGSPRPTEGGHRFITDDSDALRLGLRLDVIA